MLSEQAAALSMLGSTTLKPCTTDESMAAALKALKEEQARRNLPESVKCDRGALELCIFPDVEVARVMDPDLSTTVTVRNEKGAVRYGEGGPLPKRANVILVTLGDRALIDTVGVAELAYIASGFAENTSLHSLVVVTARPGKGKKPMIDIFEALQRLFCQVTTLKIRNADRTVICDSRGIDIAKLNSELKEAGGGFAEDVAVAVTSQLRPLLERQASAAGERGLSAENIDAVAAKVGASVSAAVENLNKELALRDDATKKDGKASNVDLQRAIELSLVEVSDRLAEAIAEQPSNEIDGKALADVVTKTLMSELTPLIERNGEEVTLAESEVSAIAVRLGREMDKAFENLSEDITAKLEEERLAAHLLAEKMAAGFSRIDEMLSEQAAALSMLGSHAGALSEEGVSAVAHQSAKLIYNVVNGVSVAGLGDSVSFVSRVKEVKDYVASELQIVHNGQRASGEEISRAFGRVEEVLSSVISSTSLISDSCMQLKVTTDDTRSLISQFSESIISNIIRVEMEKFADGSSAKVFSSLGCEIAKSVSDDVVEFLKKDVLRKQDAEEQFAILRRLIELSAVSENKNNFHNKFVSIENFAEVLDEKHHGLQHKIVAEKKESDIVQHLPNSDISVSDHNRDGRLDKSLYLQSNYSDIKQYVETILNVASQLNVQITEETEAAKQRANELNNVVGLIEEAHKNHYKDIGQSIASLFNQYAVIDDRIMSGIRNEGTVLSDNVEKVLDARITQSEGTFEDAISRSKNEITVALNNVVLKLNERLKDNTTSTNTMIEQSSNNILEFIQRKSEDNLKPQNDEEDRANATFRERTGENQTKIIEDLSALQEVLSFLKRGLLYGKAESLESLDDLNMTVMDAQRSIEGKIEDIVKTQNITVKETAAESLKKYEVIVADALEKHHTAQKLTMSHNLELDSLNTALTTENLSDATEELAVKLLTSFSQHIKTISDHIGFLEERNTDQIKQHVSSTCEAIEGIITDKFNETKQAVQVGTEEILSHSRESEARIVARIEDIMGDSVNKIANQINNVRSEILERFVSQKGALLDPSTGGNNGSTYAENGEVNKVVTSHSNADSIENPVSIVIRESSKDLQNTLREVLCQFFAPSPEDPVALEEYKVMQSLIFSSDSMKDTVSIVKHIAQGTEKTLEEVTSQRQLLLDLSDKVCDVLGRDNNGLSEISYSIHEEVAKATKATLPPLLEDLSTSLSRSLYDKINAQTHIEGNDCDWKPQTHETGGKLIVNNLEDQITQAVDVALRGAIIDARISFEKSIKDAQEAYTTVLDSQKEQFNQIEAIIDKKLTAIQAEREAIAKRQTKLPPDHTEALYKIQHAVYDNMIIIEDHLSDGDRKGTNLVESFENAKTFIAERLDLKVSEMCDIVSNANENNLATLEDIHRKQFETSAELAVVVSRASKDAIIEEYQKQEPLFSRNLKNLLDEVVSKMEGYIKKESKVIMSTLTLPSPTDENNNNNVLSLPSGFKEEITETICQIIQSQDTEPMTNLVKEILPSVLDDALEKLWEKMNVALLDYRRSLHDVESQDHSEADKKEKEMLFASLKNLNADIVSDVCSFIEKEVLKVISATHSAAATETDRTIYELKEMENRFLMEDRTRSDTVLGVLDTVESAAGERHKETINALDEIKTILHDQRLEMAPHVLSNAEDHEEKRDALVQGFINMIQEKTGALESLCELAATAAAEKVMLRIDEEKRQNLEDNQHAIETPSITAEELVVAADTKLNTFMEEMKLELTKIFQQNMEEVAATAAMKAVDITTSKEVISTPPAGVSRDEMEHLLEELSNKTVTETVEKLECGDNLLVRSADIDEMKKDLEVLKTEILQLAEVRNAEEKSYDTDKILDVIRQSAAEIVDAHKIATSKAKDEVMEVVEKDSQPSTREYVVDIISEQLKAPLYDLQDRIIAAIVEEQGKTIEAVAAARDVDRKAVDERLDKDNEFIVMKHADSNELIVKHHDDLSQKIDELSSKVSSVDVNLDEKFERYLKDNNATDDKEYKVTEAQKAELNDILDSKIKDIREETRELSEGLKATILDAVRNMGALTPTTPQSDDITEIHNNNNKVMFAIQSLENIVLERTQRIEEAISQAERDVTSKASDVMEKQTQNTISAIKGSLDDSYAKEGIAMISNAQSEIIQQTNNHTTETQRSAQVQFEAALSLRSEVSEVSIPTRVIEYIKTDTELISGLYDRATANMSERADKATKELLDANTDQVRELINRQDTNMKESVSAVKRDLEVLARELREVLEAAKASVTANTNINDTVESPKPLSMDEISQALDNTIEKVGGSLFPLEKLLDSRLGDEEQKRREWWADESEKLLEKHRQEAVSQLRDSIPHIHTLTPTAQEPITVHDIEILRSDLKQLAENETSSITKNITDELHNNSSELHKVLYDVSNTTSAALASNDERIINIIGAIDVFKADVTRQMEGLDNTISGLKQNVLPTAKVIDDQQPPINVDVIVETVSKSLEEKINMIINNNNNINNKSSIGVGSAKEAEGAILRVQEAAIDIINKHSNTVKLHSNTSTSIVYQTPTITPYYWIIYVLLYIVTVIVAWYIWYSLTIVALVAPSLETAEETVKIPLTVVPNVAVDNNNNYNNNNNKSSDEKPERGDGYRVTAIRRKFKEQSKFGDDLD